MVFYKDNWLTWFHDGVEYGPRTSMDSKFEFIFKPTVTLPLKSYKEELLANARLIRDTVNGPLDLMFSGGLDSEVILRCYTELKIPINVYTFKYENGYNVMDVAGALKICKDLNITPNIIDFNLEKFFENEAYDIWKKGYFREPGVLPHMKMIEYIDGTPLMGAGEPLLVQENGKWNFQIEEAFHSQAIYCKTIGRDIIPDWFEYSPEIQLAYCQLPEVENLFNGTAPHQDSIWNYKYHINKAHVYPEIRIRPKRHGFESTGKPFGNTPKFMQNFRRDVIGEVNVVKYFFTKDQLFETLVKR